MTALGQVEGGGEGVLIALTVLAASVSSSFVYVLSDDLGLDVDL